MTWMLPKTGDISVVPANPTSKTGSGRRPVWRRFAAAIAMASVGVAGVSRPGRAVDLPEPIIVTAARAVDVATERMSRRPLSYADSRAAAEALGEADRWLGPSLADQAPPEWVKANGWNMFTVIELFNRFNEAMEGVEQARLLDNGLVWANDDVTAAFVKGKVVLLSQAKRRLDPARYALFRVVAQDQEILTQPPPPWIRESGPRYGFDLGRFRRVTTYNLDSHGQIVSETRMEPWPTPTGSDSPAHPAMPSKPPVERGDDRA